MAYLPRMIEKNLIDAVAHFPVVVLTGARQTGKSTLLQETFGASFTYLSLDDLTLRAQAKRDPQLLLKNFPGDLIVDEVQYAPELFPAIKLSVDRKEKRRFIITGSQQFNLIRGLKESLAGRALLLQLHPMTLAERHGKGAVAPWLTDLLAGGTPPRAADRFVIDDPAQELLNGGLPGMIEKPERFRAGYLDSYVKTYVERDVPEMYAGAEPVHLASFLKLLAPLSGQLLNKSHLGRELGISSPTANRWLEWLHAGHIWTSLAPYTGNAIKRLVKTPKGCLFDSALICHLLQIGSREGLLTHPALGAIFESRVIQDVRAVLSSSLLPAEMYHWRTSAGTEVDIVIETGGYLYGFECKWRMDVKRNELRGLKAFRETYGEKVRFTGVITPAGDAMELEKGIFRVPLMQARGTAR